MLRCLDIRPEHDEHFAEFMALFMEWKLSEEMVDLKDPLDQLKVPTHARESWTASSHSLAINIPLGVVERSA